MEPIVRVVYDRKKEANLTGVGVVEAYVRLSQQKKTYIRIDVVSQRVWDQTDPESKYAKEIKVFRDAIKKIKSKKMELTLDNFNLAINRKSRVVKKEVKFSSFIDFMHVEIENDNLKETTRKRKFGTLDAIQQFGKIRTFADLVPEVLREFDAWLHNGKREDITIHTYHKHLRKICRIAYEKDYIEVDPYTKVHFSRGKAKERDPLTEEELTRVRELELTGKFERARDLFIFAAYTGLSYCDMIAFDFNEMTEKIEDRYYIDGRRIKTQSNFFTPILPYAMDILEKYDFQLPKMSNQKLNDYLRVVAKMADLRKKMTYHIARHSFATEALSHNIPIDKVARMLGHKDIKTTQIYAKILKKSIVEQADVWVSDMNNDQKSEARTNKVVNPSPKQVAKPVTEPSPITDYYPVSYTSSFTYCYV